MGRNMDDQRLNALANSFEKFITVALIGMMAVVVFLSTVELAWILIKDVLSPPIFILEIAELLEIFGMFLLVLIGIELLHSVRTYLVEREIHLQAVLAVALIAIARKVVILDIEKLQNISLVGIAAIILALTIGYFMVKRVATVPKPVSKDDAANRVAP